MLHRSNLTSAAGGLTVELVVNRYDARSKDFPLERVKDVLESPDLLTIANDYPAMNASVNRGVPLRVGAPRSKALADIEALTRKLFGAPEETAATTTPKKQSGWNLFGRLASVFSGSSA
jgi:Flp pilus assembly CpaE family ATPase